MFGIKANSTGKPRSKQIPLIRTAECLTCPKLQQSSMHKSDHERPQPIKIKLLLDQDENLRHSKKDSVRKKIQPERLGSNVKKTKTKTEGNGICTSTQSKSTTKHVQRHLNFDTALINNLQIKNDNKNQMNICENKESVYEKVSKIVRKKSMLVPPNTIKHKYLQKYSDNTERCSKTSMVTNELISGTNTDNVVKDESVEVNSAVPLTLNNKYLNVNSNADILSNNTKACTDSELHHSYTYSNSKFTNINYLQCLDSPQMKEKSLVASEYTSPKQIVTNTETQLNIESNALNDKNILCELNGRKISMQPNNDNKSEQYLCNNLQNAKLNIESDKKINHETEMICVSKDKLLCLEHNLKHLLNVAEKYSQNLKMASAFITEMLSTSGDRNSMPNTNVEEKHIRSENGNVIMVDKAVQVESYGKEIQYSEEQFKTPVSHASHISITSVGILNKKTLFQTDKNNKENEDVNITMCDNIDGSFLQLENQLNIAHMKSAPEYPKKLKTPAIEKSKHKRSLMEYMALKSSIHFLETPDGKMFKSLCQVDGTDKSVLNVRSISNKLLTDLHNLYSESPDICEF